MMYKTVNSKLEIEQH